MSVSIEPIKPLVGGRVHVDKARLCDDDVVDAIREALEERGVLVFPRIAVSDEEQLALTDRLGGRAKFKNQVPGAGVATPDVYTITLDEEVNTEPDYVLATFFWHVDGITVDMPLPKGTLLSARRLSASGGATEFANLYAAYEMLPEHEKAELEDLRVIHTIEASIRPAYGHPPAERLERWRGMAPPMEQPLVWTHESGRKSLLIGTTADGIVGMPGAHGRAWIYRLLQWAGQPDLVYRHDWEVGDLVIWNNQGLMHRVVPYTDTARAMHRTSLVGTERPGRLASPDVYAEVISLNA